MYQLETQKRALRIGNAFMFIALSQGEVKGLAKTGDAPGAVTTLCAGTKSGYPSCWSLRLGKYRRTQAGATSLAKVASIAFCLPGERVDGRYDVRLDGLNYSCETNT